MYSSLKRSPFRKQSKPMKRTTFKRRIRLDAEKNTLPSLLRKRRSGRTVLKANKPLKRKRTNPAALKWSREVLKRDNYRCQWPGGCSSGDARIDPHHIAERGLRPDLRYVVQNGIALCRTHHNWLPLHRAEAIRMGLLSDETYEKARKAA